MGCVILIVFITLITLFMFAFIYPDTEFAWHRDSEKKGQSHRIKFKTFDLMYEMNPDLWDLSTSWLCRYVPSGQIKNSHAESFYFSFNFIDFIKFKLFRKNLANKKCKMIENENAAKYLKYFKRDIAEYEKRNNQQTEELFKEIWEDKYVAITDKDGNTHIVRRKK